MIRKVIICLLTAALLSTVPLAEAQQTNKVYRIGILCARCDRTSPRHIAFRQRLRELGYVEGQNLVIEYRKKAAELVKLKVDCIFSGGTGSTRRAKKATSTIPIVMGNVGDAVGRGLVASLAKPGGNITGLTTRSPELAGKRLELLKATFPEVSRVAVLWDPSRLGNDAHFKETEVAARALGVQLQSLEVRRPYDFENAIRAASKERAEALYVFGAGMRRHRARIVELAANNRLPGTYSDTRFVTAGGLMSYAPNRVDLYRRAAFYVDRILKGAKPADLPVERPSKWELRINLKTAKKIGVTIPPSVLYRADKVIK